MSFVGHDDVEQIMDQAAAGHAHLAAGRFGAEPHHELVLEAQWWWFALESFD